MQRSWCWPRRTFRHLLQSSCRVNARPGRMAIHVQASRQVRVPASWASQVSVVAENESVYDAFRRDLYRALYRNSGTSQRADLWRRYQTLRAHRKAFSLDSSQWPRSAWSVLWQLQEELNITKEEKLQNLQALVEDMAAVGVDTAPFSRILELERCLISNHIQEAMQVWLQSSHDFRTSQGQIDGVCQLAVDERPARLSQHSAAYASLTAQWLQLGVRLIALAEDSQRMRELLARWPQYLARLEPKSIVLVIRTLAFAKEMDTLHQAWTLFNDSLRATVWTWSIEELDQICSIFVESHNPHYASSVLQMIASRVEHSDEATQSALVGRYRQIVGQLTTLEYVDRLSLQVCTCLAINTAQIDLFSVWLRASSRLGNADHLSQVIELMFEKGLSPRASHMNTLLRSWIESAGLGNPQPIEAVALTMIKKRLDQAGNAATMPSHRNSKKAAVKRLKFLERQLPAADIRTFILLTKHYLRTGSMSAAKQTLRLLEIGPKFAISTQTARSLISTHLDIDDAGGAWRLFHAMRSGGELMCDPRTAAVLWKGVNMNVASSKTTNLEAYPGPRQLFGIMLQDHLSRSLLPGSMTEERPSPSLYRRILQCFCLAEDTPGLVLALHTLKTVFGMLPDQKIVFIVARHIAYRRARALYAFEGAEAFQERVQAQKLETAAIIQRLWIHMQTDQVDKPSLQGSDVGSLESARGEELLLLLTLLIQDYLMVDRHLGRRFGGALGTARVAMNLAGHPEVDFGVDKLRGLGI